MVRMLISNDKKILLISALSMIIGFTFLFTITSLSETIIKTRQENTIKTYGKFLMVIPEIDDESEKNIKQQCRQFAYEHFGVVGNIEYADKKITMGTMKEHMGENLGFRLIKGKWPQTSNQIVVEEYLIHLFGIENEELPVCVSLQREGKPVEYEITGIISNYSYLLSTYYSGYLETKAYPSIICEQENTQDMKQSLVIMQKKMNFRNAENDIKFLSSKIDMDIMCINERIYGNGYKDNKDMIYARVFYLVLLNFLLLLEQIVMIRVFLLRNKKTLFLFEALGMSPKEKRKVIFYLVQGLIWFSLIIGYLLAAAIGFTYMNYTFGEYNKFYIYALHYNVLAEGIIAGVILLGVYFLCFDSRRESIIKEIIGDTSKRQRKYKFKKLDFSIVIIQTVCIFFTMASFNFMNTFRDESEDIDYYLCSKRTTVSYPLKEYNIAVYGDDFFSFDAFDMFDEYKDKISLSAEAETKQSTILLNKDNIDSYFRKYCESNDEKLSPKDEALWKQISNEAEQYKAIPIYQIEIVVLPQKDFHLFLNKNGINNSVLEQNAERVCVLRLPDYEQVPSNPSIKEKGMIQLGRIQGSEKNAEFCTESFKVESLLSCDEEECSNIQVIMSEEVAKKSKIVLGYDTIRVVMKKDTPISIQKGVEQKVLVLMASIQGGLLDSSGLRNHRDNLMRNYTSIMSNTILFFCIVVIYIYIIFSIYIDWEKYSYEYGVLRSFGMSYSTLQNKLFFKYSIGIIVACICSMFLGRNAFANELLTKQQILISIGITVGVTYLCKIWVFYWKKKEQISSMLNKG